MLYHSSPISGCTCRHHIIILKDWQLLDGFQSIRTIYTKLHTFTTFDKYYFALKQLKTREFWKNTNVFGFKTAENCSDAQNLPYATVSKALIGQIFPPNRVFTLERLLNVFFVPCDIHISSNST